METLKVESKNKDSGLLFLSVEEEKEDEQNGKSKNKNKKFCHYDITIDYYEEDVRGRLKRRNSEKPFDNTRTRSLDLDIVREDPKNEEEKAI